MADQTTIQNYTAALLGTSEASISALSAYLRLGPGSALNGMTNADLISAYFHVGFNMDVTELFDDEVQDMRFVPQALSDGIRWDNRLNWDTETLPGAYDGDNVDLAGNWVHYGGTTTLGNLDFGSGGRLVVTHGYLDVSRTLETGEDGAELDIDAAGQFWTNGYDGDGLLDIDIDGGRFANDGAMTGAVDMTITDGQAILATQGGRLDLGADSRLVIEGDDADVGFDGTGGQPAALRFEDGATLGFTTNDGSLGCICEFRSGFYSCVESNVQSGINLGQANLKLDLGGLAQKAGAHVLIDTDEVIGDFGEIHVSGLADNLDAEILVDYDNDRVELNLIANGSGQLSHATLGESEDARAAADLWAALTDGQPVIQENDPVLQVHDDELLEEVAA